MKRVHFETVIKKFAIDYFQAGCLAKNTKMILANTN